MIRRSLAIPFDRDGSGRFLPWLVALMVYLAALSLAAFLTLEHALAGWDRSLAGTLTVELPAVGPAKPGAKADPLQTAALTTLRATPGVVSAMPIDRAQIARLVAPYLGNDLSPDDLALPRLIDLRIDPAAPPDLAALKSALAAAAPGAVLDDHRLWLDSLLRFGRAVELTALLILTLIASVAILSVMFTTRTGLAVHRESIELLHVMGARDGYIARQFEREALRLGLIGGLIGLAVAGATLLALGHAANAAAIFGDTVTLLPALHLRGWNWAAIAALPPAAAFIAMLTARVTVMLTLLRLP